MGQRIPNLEEHLLVTAAALIEEGGPEALSLRELGRRAGVSRQTPYYYFPDKDQLIARVGELGFKRMGSRIAERVAQHADPLAQLRAGLEAYIEFALEEWNFFSLMFSTGLRRTPAERDGTPENDFDWSSGAARDAFGILVHGIIGAQQTGLLVKGDPLLIVNVFWAYTHGIALLARGDHLKHAGGTQTVFAAGFEALLDRYRTSRPYD